MPHIGDIYKKFIKLEADFVRVFIFSNIYYNGGNFGKFTTLAEFFLVNLSHWRKL